MAGRGNGYHGCDYNDILHVLIPPATHHIMCTMPLYKHGDAYATVCMDGWTDGWSVAQDDILDHMGSDCGCQNEAMTTNNC